VTKDRLGSANGLGQSTAVSEFIFIGLPLIYECSFLGFGKNIWPSSWRNSFRVVVDERIVLPVGHLFCVLLDRNFELVADCTGIQIA
jgi:hypothetical protein